MPVRLLVPCWEPICSDFLRDIIHAMALQIPIEYEADNRGLVSIDFQFPIHQVIPERSFTGGEMPVSHTHLVTPSHVI